MAMGATVDETDIARGQSHNLLDIDIWSKWIDRIDVGEVDGKERAYIEQLATGERYWLYLIWQEDWTTNPFARSKYVKGQIVYQRSAGDGAYFARPYKIEDGAVHVPPGPEHERAAPSVLPGDALKLGCIA